MNNRAEQQIARYCSQDHGVLTLEAIASQHLPARSRASLPCPVVDIFQAVKALDPPFGQYVVFGSGPLAAHGIRPTNDVDLFVTTTLYEKLKFDGWEEKDLHTPAGGLYLSNGIYEADDTWEYGAYNPTPEALIARADVIHGVPFAPLTDVVKWKEAWGRPKDLADIELIRQHLSTLH